MDGQIMENKDQITWSSSYSMDLINSLKNRLSVPCVDDRIDIAVKRVFERVYGSRDIMKFNSSEWHYIYKHILIWLENIKNHYELPKREFWCIFYWIGSFLRNYYEFLISENKLSDMLFEAKVIQTLRTLFDNNIYAVGVTLLLSANLKNFPVSSIMNEFFNNLPTTWSTTSYILVVLCAKLWRRCANNDDDRGDIDATICQRFTRLPSNAARVVSYDESSIYNFIITKLHGENFESSTREIIENDIDDLQSIIVDFLKLIEKYEPGCKAIEKVVPANSNNSSSIQKEQLLPEQTTTYISTHLTNEYDANIIKMRPSSSYSEQINRLVCKEKSDTNLSKKTNESSCIDILEISSSDDEVEILQVYKAKDETSERQKITAFDINNLAIDSKNKNVKCPLRMSNIQPLNGYKELISKFNSTTPKPLVGPHSTQKLRNSASFLDKCSYIESLRESFYTYAQKKTQNTFSKDINVTEKLLGTATYNDKSLDALFKECNTYRLSESKKHISNCMNKIFDSRELIHKRKSSIAKNNNSYVCEPKTAKSQKGNYKEVCTIVLDSSSDDDSAVEDKTVPQKVEADVRKTASTAAALAASCAVDLVFQSKVLVSGQCRPIIESIATKPIRKEKHCIQGEVSSTTSHDNIIFSPDSESTAYTPDAYRNAREVGTVKAVKQPISSFQSINEALEPGRVLLGIDYSDDDDDVGNEDANDGSYPVSGYWKVIEEATSSTEVSQKTLPSEVIVFSASINSAPPPPSINCEMFEKLIFSENMPTCSKYIEDTSIKKTNLLTSLPETDTKIDNAVPQANNNVMHENCEIRCSTMESIPTTNNNTAQKQIESVAIFLPESQECNSRVTFNNAETEKIVVDNLKISGILEEEGISKLNIQENINMRTDESPHIEKGLADTDDNLKKADEIGVQHFDILQSIDLHSRQQDLKYLKNEILDKYEIQSENDTIFSNEKVASNICEHAAGVEGQGKNDTFSNLNADENVKNLNSAKPQHEISSIKKMNNSLHCSLIELEKEEPEACVKSLDLYNLKVVEDVEQEPSTLNSIQLLSNNIQNEANADTIDKGSESVVGENLDKLCEENNENSEGNTRNNGITILSIERLPNKFKINRFNDKVKKGGDVEDEDAEEIVITAETDATVPKDESKFLNIKKNASVNQHEYEKISEESLMSNQIAQADENSEKYLRSNHVSPTVENGINEDNNGKRSEVQENLLVNCNNFENNELKSNDCNGNSERYEKTSNNEDMLLNVALCSAENENVAGYEIVEDDTYSKCNISHVNLDVIEKNVIVEETLLHERETNGKKGEISTSNESALLPENYKQSDISLIPAGEIFENEIETSAKENSIAIKQCMNFTSRKSDISDSVSVENKTHEQNTIKKENESLTHDNFVLLGKENNEQTEIKANKSPNRDDSVPAENEKNERTGIKENGSHDDSVHLGNEKNEQTEIKENESTTHGDSVLLGIEKNEQTRINEKELPTHDDPTPVGNEKNDQTRIKENEPRTDDYFVPVDNEKNEQTGIKENESRTYNISVLLGNKKNGKTGTNENELLTHDDFVLAENETNEQTGIKENESLTHGDSVLLGNEKIEQTGFNEKELSTYDDSVPAENEKDEQTGIKENESLTHGDSVLLGNEKNERTEIKEKESPIHDDSVLAENDKNEQTVIKENCSQTHGDSVLSEKEKNEQTRIKENCSQNHGDSVLSEKEKNEQTGNKENGSRHDDSVLAGNEKNEQTRIKENCSPTHDDSVLLEKNKHTGINVKEFATLDDSVLSEKEKNGQTRIKENCSQTHGDSVLLEKIEKTGINKKKLSTRDDSVLAEKEKNERTGIKENESLTHGDSVLLGNEKNGKTGTNEKELPTLDDSVFAENKENERTGIKENESLTHGDSVLLGNEKIEQTGFNEKELSTYDDSVPAENEKDEQTGIKENESLTHGDSVLLGNEKNERTGIKENESPTHDDSVLLEKNEQTGSNKKELATLDDYVIADNENNEQTAIKANKSPNRDDSVPAENKKNERNGIKENGSHDDSVHLGNEKNEQTEIKENESTTHGDSVLLGIEKYEQTRINEKELPTHDDPTRVGNEKNEQTRIKENEPPTDDDFVPVDNEKNEQTGIKENESRTHNISVLLGNKKNGKAGTNENELLTHDENETNEQTGIKENTPPIHDDSVLLGNEKNEQIGIKESESPTNNNSLLLGNENNEQTGTDEKELPTYDESMVAENEKNAHTSSIEEKESQNHDDSLRSKNDPINVCDPNTNNSSDVTNNSNVKTIGARVEQAASALLTTDDFEKRTPWKMRIKRRISQCSDINKEFDIDRDDQPICKENENLIKNASTVRDYCETANDMIKLDTRLNKLKLHKSESTEEKNKNITQLFKTPEISCTAGEASNVPLIANKSIENTEKSPKCMASESKSCENSSQKEDFLNQISDSNATECHSINHMPPDYNSEEILAVTTLISMRNKYANANDSYESTSKTVISEERIQEVTNETNSLNVCVDNSRNTPLGTSRSIILKSILKKDSSCVRSAIKKVRYDESNLLKLDMEKLREVKSGKFCKKLKTFRSAEGALLKGGNKCIKKRLNDINTQFNSEMNLSSNENIETSACDLRRRSVRNKNESEKQPQNCSSDGKLQKLEGKMSESSKELNCSTKEHNKSNEKPQSESDTDVLNENPIYVREIEIDGNKAKIKIKQPKPKREAKCTRQSSRMLALNEVNQQPNNIRRVRKLEENIKSAVVKVKRLKIEHTNKTNAECEKFEIPEAKTTSSIDTVIKIEPFEEDGNFPSSAANINIKEEKEFENISYSESFDANKYYYNITPTSKSKEIVLKPSDVILTEDIINAQAKAQCYRERQKAQLLRKRWLSMRRNKINLHAKSDDIKQIINKDQQGLDIAENVNSEKRELFEDTNVVMTSSQVVVEKHTGIKIGKSVTDIITANTDSDANRITEEVMAELRLLSPESSVTQDTSLNEINDTNNTLLENNNITIINLETKIEKKYNEEQKTAELLDSSIEIVLRNSGSLQKNSNDSNVQPVGIVEDVLVAETQSKASIAINEEKTKKNFPLKGRLDILTAEKINNSIEKILEHRSNFCRNDSSKGDEDNSKHENVLLNCDDIGENAQSFRSSKTQEEVNKKSSTKALNDVKVISANVPEALFADDESENSNSDDVKDAEQFFSPILSLEPINEMLSTGNAELKNANVENFYDSDKRKALDTPNFTVEIDGRTKTSVSDRMEDVPIGENSNDSLKNNVEAKSDGEELGANIEVTETSFSLPAISEISTIDMPNDFTNHNDYPDLLDAMLFEQVRQSMDCLISGSNSAKKWSQDSFIQSSVSNMSQGNRMEGSHDCPSVATEKSLNINETKEISLNEDALGIGQDSFLDTISPLDEVEVSTTTAFDIDVDFTMEDFLADGGGDLFAFSELEKSQSGNNSFSNDSSVCTPPPPVDVEDNEDFTECWQPVACDHSYNKDLMTAEQVDCPELSPIASTNNEQNNKPEDFSKDIAPETDFLSRSKCNPKPFWRVKKNDGQTSTPKSYQENVLEINQHSVDTLYCSDNTNTKISHDNKQVNYEQFHNNPVLESTLASKVSNENASVTSDLLFNVEGNEPGIKTKICDELLSERRPLDFKETSPFSSTLNSSPVDLINDQPKDVEIVPMAENTTCQISNCTEECAKSTKKINPIEIKEVITIPAPIITQPIIRIQSQTNRLERIDPDEVITQKNFLNASSESINELTSIQNTSELSENLVRTTRDSTPTLDERTKEDEDELSSQCDLVNNIESEKITQNTNCSKPEYEKNKIAVPKAVCSVDQPKTLSTNDIFDMLKREESLQKISRTGCDYIVKCNKKESVKTDVDSPTNLKAENMVRSENFNASKDSATTGSETGKNLNNIDLAIPSNKRISTNYNIECTREADLARLICNNKDDCNSISSPKDVSKSTNLKTQVPTRTIATIPSVPIEAPIIGCRSKQESTTANTSNNCNSLKSSDIGSVGPNVPINSVGTTELKQNSPHGLNVFERKFTDGTVETLMPKINLTISSPKSLPVSPLDKHNLVAPTAISLLSDKTRFHPYQQFKGSPTNYKNKYVYQREITASPANIAHTKISNKKVEAGQAQRNAPPMNSITSSFRNFSSVILSPANEAAIASQLETYRATLPEAKTYKEHRENQRLLKLQEEKLKLEFLEREKRRQADKLRAEAQRLKRKSNPESYEAHYKKFSISSVPIKSSNQRYTSQRSLQNHHLYKERHKYVNKFSEIEKRVVTVVNEKLTGKKNLNSDTVKSIPLTTPTAWEPKSASVDEIIAHFTKMKNA